MKAARMRRPSLLRTGMGAMDGSVAWQLYKPGFGPSVDGLFSQSNLGIVTKLGLWLMPAPEAWAAIDIAVPEFDDLAVRGGNHVVHPAIRVRQIGVLWSEPCSSPAAPRCRWPCCVRECVVVAERFDDAHS